jgi:farnesyl-diphosphate farnesyltransferase
MTNSASASLLGPLLKSVSRSFYLTLRILPDGMREPIALAYLLARAADTIADTSLIAPEKRLELLLSFRSQVNTVPDWEALKRIDLEVAEQQQDSNEKVLLESLGSALSLLAQLGETDRHAVRNIVSTLTLAMGFDLNTFPSESSGSLGALKGYSELDTYTYMVAGCVGEFWTQMTFEHVHTTYGAGIEIMMQRGIRLGKALQLTNILRDCGKDLRIGRCYLPEELLGQASLTSQDLLKPEISLAARPILHELVSKTLDHYREGSPLCASFAPADGSSSAGLFVANPHWLGDASHPYSQ